MFGLSTHGKLDSQRLKLMKNAPSPTLAEPTVAATVKIGPQRMPHLYGNRAKVIASIVEAITREDGVGFSQL